MYNLLLFHNLLFVYIHYDLCTKYTYNSSIIHTYTGIQYYKCFVSYTQMTNTLKTKRLLKVKKKDCTQRLQTYIILE